MRELMRPYGVLECTLSTLEGNGHPLRSQVVAFQQEIVEPPLCSTHESDALAINRRMD